MKRFEDILKGGDLRSVGHVNQVIALVNDQQSFDELFNALYNANRIVVMRAADAIEKITLKHPGYLQEHKKDILSLCREAKHIELKWHLALLIPRLDLTTKEADNVWEILTNQATDKKESKIVRVNSLQALYDILPSHHNRDRDFILIIKKVEQQNIPSINARIRKFKKALNL